MPRVLIEDPADPRLALYSDLRHPDAGRHGTRFIVEGETLVRRLLESDFVCESILTVDRKAAALEALAPPGVMFYVAPEERVNAVLGFKFHSGVMACALRRPAPGLRELVRNAGDRVLLVVCPELTDGLNLGSIVRLAAGFGATALLIGPSCRDPFYRQSVRVSMGTIFKLPVVRTDDLPSDLAWLKNDAGVNLVATVLDEDAEPLRHADRTPRTALLFGNEAPGLPREIVDVCDRKIVIPMRLGVDSLNVAISAGIFLYHFAGE